jgi:hypothetical protein
MRYCSNIFMVRRVEQMDNSDDNDRRAFLARAGKTAVTAPAAALLLAASSIPNKAHAQASSGISRGGGEGALLVFLAAAARWHWVRNRS